MIERSLIEKLHRVQKGSRQEQQVHALKAVFEAFRTDGFEDVPLSELQLETRIFTLESREALEKEGYVIYTLTGQSIRALREADRPFWSSWHANDDYREFEEKPSMHSEVAINPNQLFLPDSNNKALAQQEKRVRDFSKKLARKVKGVQAILGEAADYVELAFGHLDATGERLFGEKYSYNYARTKTPTVGSYVADVGCFDATDGLFVYGWRRGRGNRRVFASPLVVPKN